MNDFFFFFCKVYYKDNVLEAIDKVKEISKNNHPTLFLIDLDAIKDQVTEKIKLIQSVVRDLSENIPLIGEFVFN